MTTDSLIEDVHFRRAWTAPRAIGHKALAVNLSDLAAMGATPRACLLSLALPPSYALEEFDDLIDGVIALGAESGAPLVGGNLTRSPGPVVVDVTAVGSAHPRRVLTRRGGRPGDLLFVSGLPPYGPGDLIDVDIQDGRIWISMADYFARPLRLTRSESLSLYVRGTALAGIPGLAEAPSLVSALGKLAERLGPETLGELPQRVETLEGARTVQTLDQLRRAAEHHERLRIEYYAASSAEATEVSASWF